jgi:excisionase family DNA binding protein
MSARLLKHREGRAETLAEGEPRRCRLPLAGACPERAMRALAKAARAFAAVLECELEAASTITVPLVVPHSGEPPQLTSRAPRPTARDVSAPPSASNASDTQPLLTAEEAALLLRTSRKAVYAMIARAQLAGVTRLGRRVLIDRSELVQLLAEGRATSPERTRR